MDGSTALKTKLPSITKDFLLGTVTTKDLKHLDIGAIQKVRESVWTRKYLEFTQQKWDSIINTGASMRVQPAEMWVQPTKMGFEQPNVWLLRHNLGCQGPTGLLLLLRFSRDVHMLILGSFAG